MLLTPHLCECVAVDDGIHFLFSAVQPLPLGRFAVNHIRGGTSKDCSAKPKPPTSRTIIRRSCPAKSPAAQGRPRRCRRPARDCKPRPQRRPRPTTSLTSAPKAAEMEATLNDPGFYATRAKEGPALIAELEAAKAEVARLYARWEELGQIGK